MAKPKKKLPAQNRTDKRSISGPSSLFEKADQRKEETMASSFSAYVTDLMRKDIRGEMEHAHQIKSD